MVCGNYLTSLIHLYLLYKGKHIAKMPNLIKTKNDAKKIRTHNVKY